MKIFNLHITADTAQHLDAWRARHPAAQNNDQALWQILSVANNLMHREQSGTLLKLVKPYRHGEEPAARTLSVAQSFAEVVPARAPFKAAASIGLDVQSFGYAKSLYDAARAKGMAPNTTIERFVGHVVDYVSGVDRLTNGLANRWQLVAGNPVATSPADLQGALMRRELRPQPVEHLTF